MSTMNKFNGRFAARIFRAYFLKFYQIPRPTMANDFVHSIHVHNRDYLISMSLLNHDLKHPMPQKSQVWFKIPTDNIVGYNAHT